jgi:signal transduction histidine kinase
VVDVITVGTRSASTVDAGRPRVREGAVLAAVVAVVLGTAGLAVARAADLTLTVMVAFACTTLAVTAFLLRRDAEQRRAGLLLYVAVGCLLASDSRAVLGPAGAWVAAVTMWTAAVPLGVVLLTYPGRRLGRRWYRWLLVAVTVDYVVLWAVAVTVPLPVVVADVLGDAGAVGGVALPALVGVALAQRWRCAAAPERHAVRSVAVVGFTLAASFAARLAVRGLAELGLVADEVYAVVRTVNLACLALAPLGLLFEALRRRAAHGRLIESLLAVGGDSARIEEAMRRAVSDPTLRLTLVEGDVDVDADPPGRIRQVLRSPEGAAVAVVDADEATRRDPTQLRTVLTAGALALDNARLQAQLVRRLDELRRSRARIVEATVRARRRLERDLHDGAQQQLLAVAATLARAELIEPGPGRATAITDARHRLGEAIAELRRLARGIHPAVLDRRGLPAALGTLVDVAPVPVDVDVSAELVGTRMSLPVETTLWFVASEAVTNAARHSGADRIRLRLRAGLGWAQLCVEDDGRGGAHLLGGGGLAGLDDRVSALGGRLSVASSGTAGTRVEAVLPCAS